MLQANGCAYREIHGASWAGLGLLTALVLGATACGGPQTIPASTAPHSSTPTAGPSAGLPFPSDRDASSLTETILQGSDAYSHSSRAVVNGTAMLLAAGVQPEYAVYRFNAGGDQADSFSIRLEPGATGGVYAGKANFATQRWEFSGPYESAKTLTIDGGDYVSSAGNIWIAVLVMQAWAQVDSISIRAIHPDPVADMGFETTGGTLPLTISFDDYGRAGGSGDYILLYEWDYEDDGIFDDVCPEGSGSIAHTYTSLGTFKPILRVTNQRGQRATATATVVVVAGTTISAANDIYDLHDPSMAVVNGKPAIAYYDGTTTGVHYVQATDAAGTAWNPPLRLPLAGRPALVVVNGNPAIAASSNLGLLYVHAFDPDGQAWDQPVTVDSPKYAGKTALALFDGRPAIGYTRQPTSADPWQLAYVRAADLNGDSWGVPLVIDSADARWVSLTVVHDRPAMSYVAASTQNLRYVHAKDYDGTAWNAPLVLDGRICIGSSMAVVDGNPAVGYRDDTNGALRYVRAADPDGTTWKARVAVDVPDEYTGFGVSLAEVNSLPALSYLGPRGDLRYVSAVDADGMQWTQPIILAPSYVTGNTSLIMNGGQPVIAAAIYGLSGDAHFPQSIGFVSGFAP